MSDDRASQGLVSVVVPCCGQIEHTRLSIGRLLRHSREPFELIFLDLGGLDGTVDFLDGVVTAAPQRVEVVRPPSGDAFPAAVAEAVVLARGAFLAWVNNDVLVPALWLEQLVALLTSNPVIGMVGPTSNVAPEQQVVPETPYRLLPRREKGNRAALDTTAVDRFAAEFRQANQGQWAEVERLGGFCFLVKRELLATVPLLGGEQPAGAFDADQFGLRLRRAGHRLACCRDLFVHHFGSYLAER